MTIDSDTRMRTRAISARGRAGRTGSTSVASRSWRCSSSSPSSRSRLVGRGRKGRFPKLPWWARLLLEQ
jgi:hypothetical protein